jgi:hypothetical protein
VRPIEQATHRQLVKIAHTLLDERPALINDPDLSDALKDRVAALHFTWTYSRQLQGALESAIAQRRMKDGTWNPKLKETARRWSRRSGKFL